MITILILRTPPFNLFLLRKGVEKTKGLREGQSPFRINNLKTEFFPIRSVRVIHRKTSLRVESFLLVFYLLKGFKYFRRLGSLVNTHVFTSIYDIYTVNYDIYTVNYDIYTVNYDLSFLKSFGMFHADLTPRLESLHVYKKNRGSRCPK
jgi:hypothetical protein